MKHLSIIALCCISSSISYAQFFSSTQVYVGKDAIVSVNSEMLNQGQFISEGTLYLRKGLSNQAQLTLNGQVVLDGQGTQLIESNLPIKASNLILAQNGKVSMRTPMTIEKSLSLGNGIIETNELNPLNISDNASVVGASNISHIKGYVLKSGDDAFSFPVGDGIELHSFTISKPANYDEIKVGFVNQSPERLNSKLSMNIAEISGNSYWAVQGSTATNSLEVSVASYEANHHLLQLRNQQWNLTADNYSNNTVTAQTNLSGGTYFTVGKQLEASAEMADVSVYPNPSIGSFEVRLKGFSADENISVDIADLSGRIISTQTGKVKTFVNKYNLGQETANGNYVLRVLRTEKNESFQQNLLINK